MKKYSIAAIPGDGIGKEVIAAGVEVLAALAARDGGFKLAVRSFDWGSDYYRQHGRMMLDHLGVAAAVQRLMQAIERVTANPGLHTPDLGGRATTQAVTDGICAVLRADNA